ncbi:hypothetical protein [Anaerotignum sp.]|uniref:hypothetical protein n=1 Tax=Anaerotignum sp. TaxID=2039241 RepID=UPI0028A29EE7|nr:hypothetical protein [Anaerotignum sp.]
MDNHRIIFPALQKYYSALKSLDNFGCCGGNFFDDVSHLDTFFSEFRNITFVVQKELKTKENKDKYIELRNKYLSGETMKWFVDTRNKTTKERPFPLKKELKIDLYLPEGICSLRDEQLTVDFDTSFSEVLDVIKDIFFRKLHLVEIFFSSKIVFSEEGHDIDLYPKIKDGIAQMNDFLCELQKALPCDCFTCRAIKPMIKKAYENVMFKDLKFVTDYALEKELTTGEKVEMYFPTEKGHYSNISDIRTSLDNPLYKDSQECMVDLFKRFAYYHVVIYQMQNHNILPVFMLVYADNTYRTIPFMATTKATFYRKVQEVIRMQDFADVVAVFYCGECYVYGLEQFEEMNQKPYTERTSMATKEVLSFLMLLKSGDEMTFYGDESRIDDMEYVSEIICKADWDKRNDIVFFDWLNPIRKKLRTQN